MFNSWSENAWSSEKSTFVIGIDLIICFSDPKFPGVKMAAITRLVFLSMLLQLLVISNFSNAQCKYLKI